MEEKNLSDHEIQLLAAVIAAKAGSESDFRQIAADVLTSYQQGKDILKGYGSHEPSFDDYYHFPLKNV